MSGCAGCRVRSKTCPILYGKRSAPGGQLMISAISVWEALYLARAGRLDLGFPREVWLHKATFDAKVEVVSISKGIAARAAQLPLHHRDPADRFIIATALELDTRLISLDEKFPLYEELAGHLFAG
ncbi:MAG: VapC toxin family PIN domain ribonuclease [Candidatus Methylumidiphilus alinenensis]|uniref:VapC toxin family PIN domain ribonuclease n=1 Tax=Candidatus Methylumidiphilus alinenensis TaxID=2202197 RepID=A0A2W4RRR1_9GAMM|nr:MAG: VapC toxin family PIN domain ribonuclease [Candidatus Methylumidiphilus alinenensis]